MRVRIDYGLEHLEIDVPDERLVLNVASVLLEEKVL